MNIFEKYGSYEAVRQAAENYKKSGDRVTAAGLELQCLEHRRQHNIYEDGDDVIFNNTLYKVIDVDDMYVHLDDGAYGFAVYDYDIKHAEGKRL